MNEKQNYEINEQLVKEALVSVSQNRVLELTSQNLLLQANYQVLLAECQNFPQVLNEVEMLRGKLSELTEKSVEELEQAQQEQHQRQEQHQTGSGTVNTSLSGGEETQDGTHQRISHAGTLQLR